MSKDIIVVAKSRETTGSVTARRLRESGWIPAVVYSAKQESQSVQVEAHGFELMLRDHGGESIMLNLQIDDGVPVQVLLKDVQHHPVDSHVLHVDFHAVAMDKAISVSIPIVTVGDPKGVIAGGVIEHIMREVEVECLPGDIVEQFEVDISALEIGDSLTVADINLDKSKYVSIMEDDIALLAIVPPRKAEETGAEEIEGAEGVTEPAVIGEKAEADTDAAEG